MDRERVTGIEREDRTENNSQEIPATLFRFGIIEKYIKYNNYLRK